MATLDTMGKTEYAEAIVVQVAQHSFAVLRKNAIFGSSVWTKGDLATLGVSFDQGDTLNIRVPNVYTAEDKLEGTSITYQSPTATKVQVVLNKYKHVAVPIEDVLDATANTDVAMEEEEPMAYALAGAIEDQVASEYVNFTTVGTPGVNVTPATVRAAAQYLDDNNAPDENRSLCLKPKDIYALLGDPDFNVYFSRTQIEGMKSGIVGDLYGFKIKKSNHVYSSGGITYGMGFHRGAICLVMRPFKQPRASGVTQKVITDKSGYSMTVVIAWDQDFQIDSILDKCLYGSKTLRTELGVTVLS